MKMNTVEIDRLLESRSIEPSPPTFWQRLKTRWYVGIYNRYSKDDGGCMSSREGRIRFTPREEERFCRATLRLIERTDQWSFNDHTVIHGPSKMELWTCNGPHFFRVHAPHRTSLRSSTQARLYRAIHAVRHRHVSPEAQEFIARLETAA